MSGPSLVLKKDQAHLLHIVGAVRVIVRSESIAPAICIFEVPDGMMNRILELQQPSFGASQPTFLHGQLRHQSLGGLERDAVLLQLLVDPEEALPDSRARIYEERSRVVEGGSVEDM